MKNGSRDSGHLFFGNQIFHESDSIGERDFLRIRFSSPFDFGDAFGKALAADGDAEGIPIRSASLNLKPGR
jgi:hypothetical protein